MAEDARHVAVMKITDPGTEDAAHWERYLYDRCPIADCKLHPTPLVDRLDPDRLDPEQGFWRIVEPPQMKGTPHE